MRIFNTGFLKDQRRKVNRNYYKFSKTIPVDIVSGGITMYKSSVFNNISFDERLTKYSLGEDKEFSLNCKKRI